VIGVETRIRLVVRRAGAVAWLLSGVFLPVRLFLALTPSSIYTIRNAKGGTSACLQYLLPLSGWPVADTCSPWYDLVIDAAQTLSGLLIVLGAVMLYGWWANRCGRVGMVLMGLAGLPVVAHHLGAFRFFPDPPGTGPVGLVPSTIGSPIAGPELPDDVILQALVQWPAMGLLAVAADPGRFRPDQCADRRLRHRIRPAEHRAGLLASAVRPLGLRMARLRCADHLDRARRRQGPARFQATRTRSLR